VIQILYDNNYRLWTVLLTSIDVVKGNIDSSSTIILTRPAYDSYYQGLKNHRIITTRFKI